MLLLLLLLTAFALAVYFFAKKSRARSDGDRDSDSIATRRASFVEITQLEAVYGIPVTAAQAALERESKAEIMSLLEASIVASGLFRSEKIPTLMTQLREGSSPFSRTNTKVAFEGADVLTLEEKRALGLNTRMKYTRSFIELFDPTVFKTIEPKSALENMHLDAFHRVSRKSELKKAREAGFTHVQILPVGDARDCGKIKRFKKIHSIDQVPELPLAGCTAPYCRCLYLAVASERL